MRGCLACHIAVNNSGKSDLHNLFEDHILHASQPIWWRDELYSLQETKLLQSIDRLRGEADVVNREQKVAQALSLMAHPKSWPLSNGGLLEVHTPATTK